MRYVRIVVNVPSVSGVFDYHLPPELEESIQLGTLVTVPFGRSTQQGIVLDFTLVPEVTDTKAVISVIDSQPVISEAQIALAGEMARAFLAPLAACIGLMIPPGISRQGDTLYTLVEGIDNLDQFSPLQQKLVSLLHSRGPLRARQVARAFPQQNWRQSTIKLVGRGILQSQPILMPPTAKPKVVQTVQLACSPGNLPEFANKLGRADAAVRRKKMLEFLVKEPWPVSVSGVYAVSNGNLSDLRYLENLGLVLLSESEIWRDPLQNYSSVQSLPHQLTTDQEDALSKVLNQMDNSNVANKPILLHGVTGSGKTEIYLRSTAEALKQHKQVIILVPEIALTPQTVQRFMSRFPGQVGLYHSGLSDGERYDTWRRVRQNELSVIIGPRSALFLPYHNPGLIVVDEFHDESYYQDEAPVYNAVQAALSYAQITRSPIILGSATPDLCLYHQASRETWPVLNLPRRIYAHADTSEVDYPTLINNNKLSEERELPLPEVRIVDMRAELKAGNSSIFSFSLQESLKTVLQAGQQAILFLNRRGSSTYVFCRDCGYTLRCPNCEIPLTFHLQQSKQLTCHVCGYTRQMPASCPQCSSKRIRHYGTGTERVETEVKHLLSGVRTLRWDFETSRGKGAHEMIMQHFKNHQADVLIGTQMLAKGLDLPLVTLVGVILADVGLTLPDYRASERTFQLLMQVAGRAGRSPLGGHVIIQSFMPEHYAIQAAARHDYSLFYQKELDYRHQLKYPPYIDLVRMEYRHLSNEKAKAAANLMAERLHDWIKEQQRWSMEMIGPVRPFYERINRLYRWQIILKGANPAALLVGKVLPDWRVEVNPPTLL